jgi:hypothetical protein
MHFKLILQLPCGFTKTVQMNFYILPSGRAIISLEEAGIVHFPASS